MKSTKVQNPWRIVHILLIYYANARAGKLGTPALCTATAGGGGGGGGGFGPKIYACALFIIDGLCHATWPLMMSVSRSRTVSL